MRKPQIGLVAYSWVRTVSNIQKRELPKSCKVKQSYQGAPILSKMNWTQATSFALKELSPARVWNMSKSILRQSKRSFRIIASTKTSLHVVLLLPSLPLVILLPSQ